MTAEFDLIKRFFSRPVHGVVLGVGDDAALLDPSPGYQLAVTTDTLVADVHFFADVDPVALGWKAVAVNLSDLAAMGAKPRWLSLALTLPDINDHWLAGFAQGFYDCAERAGAVLIGGDTTQGPLAITVTAMGEIQPGVALRRDTALAGEDIWVSGTLGDAALGLAALQGRLTADLADQAVLLPRLLTPAPRNALGLALVGLASACIDVSDGLLADLGHILERSSVGAVVRWPDVPVSLAATHFSNFPDFRVAVLAGGDDYELCFTAPTAKRDNIQSLADTLAVRLSLIGQVVDSPGLRVLDAKGQDMDLIKGGYEHFTA